MKWQSPDNLNPEQRAIHDAVMQRLKEMGIAEYELDVDTIARFLNGEVMLVDRRQPEFRMGICYRKPS